MPAAIAITNTDYTHHQLRQMALKCKCSNHSRRLFAIASVCTGKSSRTNIADHAGVGIQTLRDWVICYNESGPEGLRNRPGQGRPPLLDKGQLVTLKGWLETGPPEGWARWTVALLRKAVADVFCVSLSREGIRRLIRKMGFRRLSPRPIHPRKDMKLQEDFCTGFSRIATSHLPAGIDLSKVDVWFQDEARIGQKGMLSRIWARKGTRPRIPRDYRYGYCYLFSALCPARGEAIGHVCDRANTVEMNRHLKDIGAMVPKGHHALVIFDGAGWHRSRDLACPDNVSVLRLPPYSPELNSAENVFQFLKANHFANQVFETAEDVKTRVAAVWETFAGQAERIQSIGHRSWARVH